MQFGSLMVALGVNGATIAHMILEHPEFHLHGIPEIGRAWWSISLDCV
jgi:hypothetical protein